MTGTTSVPQACTESFTQHELDEAAAALAEHMRDFVRNDEVGQRFRDCAVEMFKADNGLHTDDPFVLHLHADLLADDDIAYAVELMMSDDEE